MKVHGQYNTARVCRLFHQFASLGAQSVLDDASSAERVDLVPYRKLRRDVLARLGDGLAQSGAPIQGLAVFKHILRSLGWRAAGVDVPEQPTCST